MTGKISLDLMNAAKINYVNQRAQGTTRINTASRTQRESSLLSPSHTPALSRRRRREIEEEDFKEMETINNNTITPQRLQIQRTTNSTRTRQRQVTTLMPLQNVPELSRRRPRNYDDEDISSAATTRNPRSRRSHRGINELRPNNLINERHITLNEQSTVEGHTDERVHLNNATGYENNIGNLLLPIQKEHLSTEEYVIRTLETFTIDRIDQFTASWILVYLFREAMNYAVDEYGACTWSKPDNWNSYVEHFRTRFNDRNETYPWGQNGYIGAEHQDYLYSLGDVALTSALDIYIDTIKDWYKYTFRNYTGGISMGIFPRSI